MILKGNKVILRSIEREDLDFIIELVNDPNIEKTIVGWTWPLSRKDEEQWYTNFRNSNSTVRYIIETVQDGAVGLTGLTQIDWKNGSAKGAGIRIKPNVQTRGLATDAYMTMFRFAFDELRLHRITTSVFEDNVASLRFMEKCGCKIEGVQREAIYKNGKYYNLVTLGILDVDYKKHIKETEYWSKYIYDNDR